jgi:hypothetical protein
MAKAQPGNTGKTPPAMRPPAGAPSGAPAGAPAPLAPAQLKGAQTTQSPAPPNPDAAADSTASTAIPAPELTALPSPISPAGVTLPAHHVPAPIPPRTDVVPGVPHEAQPLAQGSLTPAQEERVRERNPALKAAPSPIAAKAPGSEAEASKVQLNDDGFVPGEEVDPAKVLEVEQRNMRAAREERARKAAADAKK